MKSVANHRIHKQTIDIRFRDFTTLNSWNTAHQAKTAEVVRRSIERCFEEYDAIKEYLTIDRLEIDLGVFNKDQLLSKMPEKLYDELQKILGFYHVEMNHNENAQIIHDRIDKRIPLVKNSETAAFLFFLQHGYLPWWYSNEPAWNTGWLQKLTGENWQELRNFLTTYPENEVYYERALSRLIAQFNDGFLASLLNGLQLKEPVEKAWSWLTHFYEALQKVETDFSREESALPPFSVLRHHFWKKWLGYATCRSAIPELAELFVFIKQPSLITYFLSGIAGNSEWIDSVPGFWQDELISLKQQEYKSKLGLSIINEFIDHAKSEKFKEPQKAERIPEEDSILVPDAGLVLLHPFLPRLFEHCDWLKENEFVNDDARNHAVYALHYLAAGNEEAPEYVLMLPKLLCGIPLEWPLEQVLLTGKEKASCDEMLVQVIAHWKALGNTSPAGLRETFLWRQGKLFSTDEGWCLEVQRKTEDILLNQLPWGFSMIKFSWMPRLLYVFWE